MSVAARVRAPSAGGGAGGAEPDGTAALDAVRRSGARRRRRTAAVLTALSGMVLVLSVLSLMLGDIRIPLGDVVATLLGRGEDLAPFVVLELRLPRLLIGLLTAVAFGVAGALFQSVLRNPLASPDIIGISGGASVGAVLGLLVLGLGGLGVSVAALVGAGAVAVAVTLLSWGDGEAGQRFVLTGIGCAFIANAVLGYLLTRSDVRDAQAALVWMVGSLGSTPWSTSALVGLALAALLLLAALLAGRVRILQLGEDLAAGLGVSPVRTRLAALAIGVALAAVATAAVGPVAFVAFTAAPIARRLLRDGGVALTASARVAVVVMLGSDLVAQHLLPGDVEVPVGIVTGAIGGPYLLWLLATASRPGRQA